MLQSLSLLKPPSLSPPPVIFRLFERPPPEETGSLSTAKIVTHNEKVGSKIMTFSEKVTPIPSKNEASINQEKNKLQRKCSWKLGTGSSFKKRKNKGDSESEATPLNNGRNHSQCNGGNVARQVSMTYFSLKQHIIHFSSKLK